MTFYQLSSLLRVVVGLLLLGQIHLIQCSDQSILQFPERSKPQRNDGSRPPRHAGSWNPPKPIGIDFGPEYVVAAYAHSPTNVTILAMISVKNSSHADYFENMMLLRLANDDRVAGAALLNGGRGPVPTGKEILTAVKRALRYYLGNKMPSVPFFGGLKDAKSASWIWVNSLLDRASGIIDSVIIYALDKVMEGTGIVTAHERLRRRAKSLNDNDIKRSFYPVIVELKDLALKNHNVTIDFAVLSLPDYFPPSHEYIPFRALRSFGIEVPRPYIPKPIAALAGVVTQPDARILIFDHGRHHMGVQAFQRHGVRKNNPIKGFNMPFDSFGGDMLEMDLYKRVTSKGVLSDQLSLKKKFKIDHEGWVLLKEIERARILIRDNLFDCIGKDRNDEEDCEVDRHHDEWPLKLDHWWTIIEYFGPSSIPPVVLKWEDVQASEEYSAESLSNNLNTLLRFMRKARVDEEIGEESDMGAQQEVDVVLIVTDQPHGAILRRAAKLTVGEGVRIYGGRIADFTMAAEGVAVLAFKRRRHWFEIQEYEDSLRDYEDGYMLEPPVCKERL
ncbi:hypothetical protein VE03_04132 [Pseudogymnoascus sp. 23342-1-I1]|nr:hypothetical protein VE03_04132 [Pseudogymnoascus sp. 23342-1-I1]